MNIPTLKTWVDRETVTPQDLNGQIRDPLTFLINPPRAILSNPTQFAIPGAAAAASLTAVELDTDSMYNASTPTRVTVNTPGTYHVTATVHMMNVAGSWRTLEIHRYNSSGLAVAVRTFQITGHASSYNSLIASGYFDCDAGDYFQVLVGQGTGAGLNSAPQNTQTGDPLTFAAAWVGSA